MKKILIFIILLFGTVNVMAAELTLNKQEITLNINEKFSVYDINYYNTKEKYTYQSSNSNIATVDSKGLVEAKKSGNAIITVTDSKKNSSKVSVHVTPITNYTINNNKEIVPCGIDNNLIKEYNDLLDKFTNNHQSSRSSVVAAIRYLALQFPYNIPYYWRDNMMSLPKYGHYAYEGLNLNSTDGWGCKIKKTARAKENYTFYIGKKYPNGLECSGLVTWALTNGGFASFGDWSSYMFQEKKSSSNCNSCTYRYQDMSYYNDFNDDGKFYKDRYTETEITNMFNTFKKLSPNKKICINSSCGAKENSNKKLTIKSGDLIWKEGHIGMIISVERDSNSQNKKIYIVESIRKGITVSNYTPKELLNNSKEFTHIINMDEIYIDNMVNDNISSNTNQIKLYIEGQEIIKNVVSNNNTYGKLPIITKKDSLSVGWFTSNGKKIEENNKIDLTGDISLYNKFLVCGDIYDNSVICDVNNDQKFNIGDATTLLRYLVGTFKITNPQYADANGDQTINTGDVITMIKQSMRQSS